MADNGISQAIAITLIPVARLPVRIEAEDLSPEDSVVHDVVRGMHDTGKENCLIDIWGNCVLLHCPVQSHFEYIRMFRARDKLYLILLSLLLILLLV